MAAEFVRSRARLHVALNDHHLSALARDSNCQHYLSLLTIDGHQMIWLHLKLIFSTNLSIHSSRVSCSSGTDDLLLLWHFLKLFVAIAKDIVFNNWSNWLHTATIFPGTEDFGFGLVFLRHVIL